MKKFTPPPQCHHNSASESEEESDRSETSNSADDIVRASDKTKDEYLIMVSRPTENYLETRARVPLGFHFALPKYFLFRQSSIMYLRLC